MRAGSSLHRGGTLDAEIPCAGSLEEGFSIEHRIVRDLAYLGNYLHLHGGGRGGMSRVLVRLLVDDGAQTLRGLQEETGISSAALSEVVGKLEAKGLVTKSVSEDDGRQRDISLTPAGCEEAVRLRGRQDEFLEDFLGTLNGERAQLATMLDGLVAHWQDMETKRENADG